MNETLLTILSALVAVMVWLVRSMNTRSDKLIAQRDKEVARLIKSLEMSVTTFKNFEVESGHCFTKLVDRLDSSQETQELILAELRSRNRSAS